MYDPNLDYCPKCHCEVGLPGLCEECNERPYNVVENVAGTYEYVAKADVVIAFCDGRMYFIKNRYPYPESGHTTAYTPKKPDLVVAYYSFPEPHVRELRMRTRE